MNSLGRIALICFCLSLCAGGLIAIHGSDGPVADLAAHDGANFANDYAYVASGPRHEVAFSEFESVIRRHNTVVSHRGRIEFGSVQMEGATAIVQVLFFAPDGRMTPFFYTLVPKNKSWRIQSVQRIWFVPRSHLLRGVRV